MTSVIDQAVTDRFSIYNGDCIEVVRALPESSVGYSVFSPPFASLYTYSASDRDMGNCATHEEFYKHFAHLVPELLRVTQPGRLLSFHCMNLPTSKARDGFIGLSDFRGILIKAFVDAGWIYHSEVCIWKDPVTAMQRTKALGLLHKTIRKDSAMSRQGVPDYLVTMRKPGMNPVPIEHEPGTESDYPVSLWQQVASPVWVTTRESAAATAVFEEPSIGEYDDEESYHDAKAARIATNKRREMSFDPFFKVCVGDADGTDHGTIHPGDTLQKESAREEKDERHICPLQLEVIRRAVRLWSKADDVVLSPFAGIGSEGYVALQEGRRFVGAELKASYFKQAVRNLQAAERAAGRQGTLFG